MSGDPAADESWIDEIVRKKTAMLRAENERLREENSDMKISVMAFLAPHAARYQKDYELDGLHPVHYDLLERCGARMKDFKRADIPGEIRAEPSESQ